MSAVDLFEQMVSIALLGMVVVRLSRSSRILARWRAPAMTLVIGGFAGAFLAAIAASPSAATLSILLLSILITLRITGEFDGQ